MCKFYYRPKDEGVLCHIKCSLLLLLFLVGSLVDKTSLDLVENSLVSVFERLLETVVESNLASSSLCLLSTSSLGSLLLDRSGTGGLASDNSLLFGSASSLGVRVESLHKSLVVKRVLLALGGFVVVDTLHAELGLNLVRVDDSGKISAGHHASSELEAALLDASLSVGTEDVVELFESILGPDDESTEVTTGSELEQVQSGDVASVNTWEVPGGLLDLTVLVTIDDQGSLTEGEASISELTLTGAVVLGGTDAGEVTSATEVVEALDESSSLLLVDGVNDEGKLRDIFDSVTAGHNEGTASGSGESGGNSVSFLVSVNLSLPFSPDLERGEHATLTAHVTEGTLA